MTQAEVGKLLAFVTAVYPNIDIRDGTVDAWHDLLCDLDYKIALAAAKKVVAESDIPALPAVGKIRKAALDLQNGDNITAPEAWGMVVKAVKYYGYYNETKVMSELPPNVTQVVRWMGWQEICHSNNPDVIRAQFMRMYEIYCKREQEIKILPSTVKNLFKTISERKCIPSQRMVKNNDKI